MNKNPARSFVIRPYQSPDLDQLVFLILDIQQNEFHVPITIHDQPDLLNIESIYKRGKGNFWCAIEDDKVVGTIGMIDIGDHMGVIRKMFVHKNYRGKDKGAAQELLNNLFDWSSSNDIRELLLGTIDTMHAAHRFYIRNGFVEIKKESLPPSFPLMPVDNVFFKKMLDADA